MQQAVKTPREGVDPKELKAAGKAAIVTTNAIVSSIDKFKSGDNIQIAQGIFNIIAEVSKFVMLAGPMGAAVGPICSIVSCILGLFGNAPSPRKPCCSVSSQRRSPSRPPIISVPVAWLHLL